jgi:Tfp pilus assembly major pilin PilA
LYGFTDKEITDNVLSPIKDAPFGDVKTLENGSVQKVAGVENNSQNTAQTTNSGVSTNTSTGGTAIGTSTNSTTSGASSGGTALGTSNGSTTPKTPVTDPTDPFQQPGTSVTRTPI